LCGGQTSPDKPRLVESRMSSIVVLLPRAQLGIRYCSNKLLLDPRRRGSAKTCSSRCTLWPAARAARSAYSKLAARSAIRSGTRYAKWAGGSRSQTHRQAAMGGFTQDDGYVRGVVADAQALLRILDHPFSCHARAHFGPTFSPAQWCMRRLRVVLSASPPPRFTQSPFPRVH